MTKKEMIADFTQKLEEHEFTVLKESTAMSIAQKDGYKILSVSFKNNKAYIGGTVVDADDLIEYSWLFMRTGIFLNDLRQFESN